MPFSICTTNVSEQIGSPIVNATIWLSTRRSPPFNSSSSKSRRELSVTHISEFFSGSSVASVLISPLQSHLETFFHIVFCNRLIAPSSLVCGFEFINVISFSVKFLTGKCTELLRLIYIIGQIFIVLHLGIFPGYQFSNCSKLSGVTL